MLSHALGMLARRQHAKHMEIIMFPQCCGMLWNVLRVLPTGPKCFKHNVYVNIMLTLIPGNINITIVTTYIPLNHSNSYII